MAALQQTLSLDLPLELEFWVREIVEMMMRSDPQGGLPIGLTPTANE